MTASVSQLSSVADLRRSFERLCEEFSIFDRPLKVVDIVIDRLQQQSANSIELGAQLVRLLDTMLAAGAALAADPADVEGLLA